jgi:lipopolysaccharide biosynthesis regulator YciM
MEEIEEIKKKKLQSIQEEKRRIHVTKGKAYLKKKDFINAIESFENAFSLRMDKDVFVYLAHIYKGLKRTNALNHLLQRWQQVSERQEKEKILEKEREKGRERVNALTKKNQEEKQLPDLVSQPPEMTINLFD